MAEGAALLVDHVLPAVGYRQWVLSFEGPLAVRLGYDRVLLAKVAQRLARAVMQDMRWSARERHGLATVESLHALAACVQLGLAGPHLVPPQEPATRPTLTVAAFGMHLHAATTVDGRDRKQPGRVCRYLLRPPFAHDAVVALPDGRVRVLFKAPWLSGADHADMPPYKFLARLCALVPPPGFHMTRYYGVLANRHHLRARILPPSRVPRVGSSLLELAPAFWKQTLQQQDTQKRLAADVFRTVSLAEHHANV